MLRTGKGISPLKALSALHPPWDSMENLDVVGKGVYDSRRTPPLWLALPMCFTAVDLCHFPTRIFLDVYHHLHFMHNENTVSETWIYAQHSPVPEFCSPCSLQVKGGGGCGRRKETLSMMGGPG